MSEWNNQDIASEKKHGLWSNKIQGATDTRENSIRGTTRYKGHLDSKEKRIQMSYLYIPSTKSKIYKWSKQ